MFSNSIITGEVTPIMYRNVKHDYLILLNQLVLR